jgi:hypothetical protein
VSQPHQTNLEEKPHETSVAVWDVPSPVAINSRFKVKVGVSCSATCQLAGCLVEVRDEHGRRVGEGRLGREPWPGTRALYWAEIEMRAPAAEGLAIWAIAFSGERMELAHSDASFPFSFKADAPPEHRVTITVIASDTGAPIGNADVRLGVYRAATDESGVARCEIPKGAYDVQIWSDGYEGPPMSVKVTEDAAIEVKALKSLTAAETEEELERLELSQWG